MSYNYQSNVKTCWYNDIPFKSQIEAKWYKLYNDLELSIFYENKSFTLKNYPQYTPDIYIEDFDIYHEIKLCKYPTLDEFKKCHELSSIIQKDVLLTWSDLSLTNLRSILYRSDGSIIGNIQLTSCIICNQINLIGKNVKIGCSHDNDSCLMSYKLESLIKNTLKYKFIKS
jgi:hypothetical protein